jgi:hypothetical protein
LGQAKLRKPIECQLSQFLLSEAHEVIQGIQGKAGVVGLVRPAIRGTPDKMVVLALADSPAM